MGSDSGVGFGREGLVRGGVRPRTYVSTMPRGFGLIEIHESATAKGERGFYLARVIRADNYPIEF
ncbi:hypothetical protein ADK64_22540 [Streptomyces sp. MMG1121]|nr:hypothetical protein ADK64_22540 [Streptomyces sp. MMG1121]